MSSILKRRAPRSGRAPEGEDQSSSVKQDPRLLAAQKGLAKSSSVPDPALGKEATQQAR